MVKKVVIIPAAGRGSRMGGAIPKQFLPLLGKPLIQHTLEVFSKHDLVTEVVVVLAADDEDFSLPPKCRILHCGGGTRAATVLNALHAIDLAQDDWVLVHDAVRPCLTHAMLDHLFAVLSEDKVGGLLALPLADTLKRGDAGGRVADTVPRDGLWQAQTPQMFRYGLLTQALETLGTATPTDEAQAVEHLGFAPKLVTGDARNLKVTYPQDLALAELILRSMN
ncbi:MAG: 2-C-methyl-D-erythritol 4-phosphate cytidylyltransferase [Methylophilales bacterium]|nr:2-C-methyl-D-erythritol 4-phosphate cytidylyltransferase [Methylophilales bacterium]